VRVLIVPGDENWQIAAESFQAFRQKQYKNLPERSTTTAMSRIETAFLFDLDVEPDLFLMAADRLGAEIEHCVVIGDAIWNMLAAHRREHWGWIALRRIRPGGTRARWRSKGL